MKKLIVGFFLITGISFSALAEDAKGYFGQVLLVEANGQSSDTYLNRHGMIMVDAQGVVEEYRWGGLSCGTKILTAEDVTRLTNAIDSKSVLVQVYSKPGQGQVNCIVGYRMAAKGVVGSIE